MTDNLLPCPFCGKTHLDVVVIDIWDPEGLPAARTCLNCGAQGPRDYIPNESSTEKIDKQWNERAKP